MANIVRCIHYYNPNGSDERVIFTRDMDAATSDFIPSGMTLLWETDMHENDFPNYFPFDHELKKQ